MADSLRPKGHNPGLTERWYVAHTQAHREKRAAANLICQGFRVFLPLHRRTVRHARQFRTVLSPFLPGYLFVRLSVLRDRWRSVNGTFGISHLVMEGEAPKPVPRGIVEEMLAAADEIGILAAQPDLAPGQSVRILTGPFAGLVGELMALDEHQRVKVLVDILGNPTPVAVGARTGLVPVG
jgi:transcriptional antiterminator RfaH